MLSDHLKEFVARPDNDRYLGSADADNVPSIAYASAARAVDDTHIEAFIQARMLVRARANLVPGAKVSFTFGQMMGAHEMYQVKGVLEEFRGPVDITAETQDYVDTFVGLVDELGLPPGIKDRVQQTPWTEGYVVLIRVEQLFGQTPGPGAGDKLKEAGA